MKNLWIFLILFLFGTLSLSAQQVGVKALGQYGLVYGNSEEVDGESIESSSLRGGYGAGITSDFNTGGLIGVRLELLYEFRQSQTDAEFSGTVPLTGITYEIDNSTSNDYYLINLPVLLSLNIGNVSLYAGPGISYTFSASGDLERMVRAETADGTVVTDINAEVEDIDYFGDNSDRGFSDYSDEPAINAFNIDANIGVIFDVTNVLQLDLRIFHGLTDLTNDDYDQSILTGDSREDKDTWAGFQLALGFAF